ncbi:MAG: ABC transporter permease [Microbacterium sp.]|nr:ABC transporter permease [Microbacterium sp.]
MNDAVALADEFGLTRMGARPPLFRYLRQAWERRHFAIAMSRFAVEARNSRSRLGVVWVVARPLLMATAFGLVFGVILPAGIRPPNFLPYLFVGVFTFEYFAQSFSQGAKSITGNMNLVSSLSFPRILLPVSAVLRIAIETGPIFLVLFVILWVTGNPPRWGWFMAIPILLLLTVFNLGVALISARLTVALEDLSNLIPFVTRLLFYTSGVFYAFAGVFDQRPDLLFLVQFNPVYDFIAAMRSYLIGTAPIDWVGWAVAGGTSLVLFVVGVLVFWQAEERYGRE